jgi:Protein of unknown function (DUF2800)
MSTHAKNFPPSSAYRWLECGQSVGAPPGAPSDASELGTAAHELLEKSLTEMKHPEKFLGQHFNVSYVADAHMVESVGIAFDYLLPITENTHWGTETQVTIPDTGETGTTDFWACDKDGGTLLIADYKNGMHRVEAKDNPQLKLYALGLLDKVNEKVNEKPLYIGLTIIQPNVTEPMISTHIMKVKELIAWGKNVVAPQVKLIKSNKAPYVPGKHCTYCHRASSCKALASHMVQAARTDWGITTKEEAKAHSPTITNDELAILLSKIRLFEFFAKSIRVRAMAVLAKDPKAIPGWKLVEATSKRKWIDNIEHIMRKRFGMKPEAYSRYQMKTMSEVASLFNKSKREAFMESLTTKPRGFATLAPASDKRPPIGGNARLDFAADIEMEDV